MREKERIIEIRKTTQSKEELEELTERTRNLNGFLAGEKKDDVDIVIGEIFKNNGAKHASEQIKATYSVEQIEDCRIITVEAFNELGKNVGKNIQKKARKNLTVNVKNRPDLTGQIEDEEISDVSGNGLCWVKLLADSLLASIETRPRRKTFHVRAKIFIQGA
ncbi:MAG: hypothetical protein UT66_C0037G0004 [candidate division CPR2 bacterium GW2011_GWC1_39_9]|nr:MAG: hypothetical protein UT66_C0037G0004 [candidate division CPR2 bacterium GW2011_GWC1_39_9]